MITVFFETKGYAEQAATFHSEEAYMACLPALEKLCEEKGFDSLTESTTD